SGRGRREVSISAAAIARLPLRRVDLIVLSSCSAAQGRQSVSEGAMGLVYAFKRSGVRYVIANLGPVPDEVGSEMFPIFYAALRAGNPPVIALQIAQLRLLRSRRPGQRTP